VYIEIKVKVIDSINIIYSRINAPDTKFR